MVYLDLYSNGAWDDFIDLMVTSYLLNGKYRRIYLMGSLLDISVYTQPPN